MTRTIGSLNSSDFGQLIITQTKDGSRFEGVLDYIEHCAAWSLLGSAEETPALSRVGVRSVECSEELDPLTLVTVEAPHFLGN